MADYNQVIEALRNADAAGDVEAARRLAAIADGMRSRPQEQAATPEDPIAKAANTRPSAGIIDAAGSLLSGAVAGPMSGLAGLAQGAKNLVSPGMEPGDRVRQVQDALTYQPRSELGKGITKAVSYPFVKLAELADYAGRSTADVTGSPAAGTGANLALQTIPLMIGRIKPEAALEKPKPNLYDQGVTKAKEAGYVLPPSQANPSLFNQIVEGVAGKVKTAQTASLKNQEVTNGLVKKGLGIAEDAPLTVDTLEQVRRQAGQNYERIRSSGRVTADPVYSEALDSIAEPYLRAAKDFPESARTDILDAVKAAKKESFDASSAVDQIRVLRGKANAAYAKGDKDLGSSYKDIAGAIEDQLGRHLEEIGSPESVINDFRKSREIIAKSYSVQKHLGADGNVNANGLAQDLKRSPKKLSGEMRTVAEFAQQFPKAAQRPERVGGVPLSLFDLAIGGGASALMHNPYFLAATAARPAVRNAILSKAFQKNFVNPPTPSQSILSMLQETQQPPLIPLSEISEGQRR